MSSSSSETEIPQGPLPLLPFRDGVLFPVTAVAVPVGRKKSLELLRAMHPGDQLVIGFQRDPGVADPALADLLPIAIDEHLVGKGRGMVDPRACILIVLSLLAGDSVGLHFHGRLIHPDDR